MRITKFNLLNQRGTKKLIMKTLTHYTQCKLIPRSLNIISITLRVIHYSGQAELEPLVRRHLCSFHQYNRVYCLQLDISMVRL